MTSASHKAKLKILVIGGGGREHALCWALAKAASAPDMYCAPGNPGIAQVATCVQLGGYNEVLAWCEAEQIDLVVIGPEQPLVDGLADRLRANGVAVIGPNQRAAQLEGSKDFTKQLCVKYNIPTAAGKTFESAEPALKYARAQGAPIVVKADGLAAGKGVTVAMKLAQAEQAIAECFDGRFGDAGQRVVIEEFMQGEEISFFALCDGESAIELGFAQDHKRVGEGDTGPNTGGMGTYSTPSLMSQSLRAQVMREIILPTVAAMKAEGSPYHGILFAGLMITDSGPRLIEYNCRLGDPETQVVLPRITSDLAQLLYVAAMQGVKGLTVESSNQSAMCVVMAAKGYPGDYTKGSEIRNIEEAQAMEDVMVFHAGTRIGRNCGKLKANGGRVLGVTALGDTLEQAQKRAYAAVDVIDWKQGFCRRDIGWRALKKA